MFCFVDVIVCVWNIVGNSYCCFFYVCFFFFYNVWDGNDEEVDLI